MNFFKKLFGSQNTSEEVKEEKNFDVLKYDGVRALRMQQFDYAAKCFVLALELNADDLECRDYLSQAYISLGDMQNAYTHSSWRYLQHSQTMLLCCYAWLTCCT